MVKKNSLKIALVVFSYNRPNHIAKTLKSIKNNQTHLIDTFIFNDGPKNSFKDKNLVSKTVAIIKKFNLKKKVYLRNHNIGLKESVKLGLNLIFNRYKYDAAIILEDDIIINKYFINYMINALNFYKNKKKIGSITGYNFLNKITQAKELHLSYRHSSWGWGTWKNVWKLVNWNLKYTDIIKNNKKLKKINQGGEDLIYFLKDDNESKISSWSVYFDICCILNNLFCVFPSKSLLKNIGFDNTGRHCRSEDKNHENDNYDENFFVDCFQNLSPKSKKNQIIFKIIRKKFSPKTYRKILKLFFIKLGIINKS